jgi:ABC-2 type transport system permease protein
MKTISLSTIYVLWLREMKKFVRSKSRIVGSLVTPLLFLGFFSFGFGSLPVPGATDGVNYVQFLIPGIIGMGLLFSSTFAGLTVLLDRQFGFLKEIMVAPVTRVSIVLGRTAGAITTGLIQALLILAISLAFQLKVPGIFELLAAIVFMILTATAFIGIGLIFASKMKDPQGFNLIVNFLIFPLFFLSGALFPLQNLPEAVRYIAYADPLTFGVDGMRAALIGVSVLPAIVDFVVLLGLSGLMLALGAYSFEKSESV